MVPSWPVFHSGYSLEYLHYGIPRLRESWLLSLYSTEWIWMLNLLGQSFSLSSVPAKRTIPSSSLGSDCHSDTGTLVTRQSGQLAILLSLRHDSASLDVSSINRQWSGEDFCTRG